MKQFLSILCVLLGFSAYTQDIKELYYETLLKKDFEKADSILREWEKTDAENPELIPARFNMYVNRAHNSIMVLDDSTNPEREYLALSDSLGNQVGSFYEKEYWNDSLLIEAIKIIDQGIELYPNRLDFRFGKATLCSQAYYWEDLYNTAINTLEYSRLNDCKWQWTDGVQFDAEQGKDNMLEGIHQYEGTLAENQYPATINLVDLNLKFYPNDPIALNFKGYFIYSSGDKEKGIEYIEQAYKNAPDDPLIICNLAYMNYEIGNNDTALSLYKIVLENDNFNNEWKEVANDMVQEITKSTQEMRPYEFEFQFIPYYANRVEFGEDAIDLLCDIKYITGPRLKKIGYTIPDEYKDIKVDVIGTGEDAIVVWTLPDPTEIPLAKYIAFVLNKETKFYKVYTLEKSIDEKIWILGQALIDGHSSITMLDYQDTAQKFVEQLIKHISDKPVATSKHPSK